jgi:hypothetical protein
MFLKAPDVENRKFATLLGAILPFNKIIQSRQAYRNPTPSPYPEFGEGSLKTLLRIGLKFILRVKKSKSITASLQEKFKLF